MSASYSRSSRNSTCKVNILLTCYKNYRINLNKVICKLQKKFIKLEQEELVEEGPGLGFKSVIKFIVVLLEIGAAAAGVVEPKKSSKKFESS